MHCTFFTYIETMDYLTNMMRWFVVYCAFPLTFDEAHGTLTAIDDNAISIALSVANATVALCCYCLFLLLLLVLKLGFLCSANLELELRQNYVCDIIVLYYRFDLSVSINMPLMDISLDAHTNGWMWNYSLSWCMRALVSTNSNSSSSRMHEDWISCA